MTSAGLMFPACDDCGHNAWSHGSQSGFPAAGEPCRAAVTVTDDGAPDGYRLADCRCLGYANETVWPISIADIRDDDRLLDDIGTASVPPGGWLTDRLTAWRDEGREGT